ncbi:MAG: hypothetical protein KAR40_13945 [Candidatus Sabulitectum sp.]|nr:hypothetical protein [Candidatus Sabulitectum sp.]
MGDAISITIEERKVEVTALSPTLTQINLLDPVILAGVSENTDHRLGDGSDHSDVAVNTIHRGRPDNPHAVDKAQVGLGNVTDDSQLKRSAGDNQAFTQKISPELADSILGEDSADGENKKRFTLEGIKTLFQAAFNLLYAAIFNRLNHGTITVSKTLNATTASEQTADFSTAWTATIAGLTAARPSMLFQFVVSGGGLPTVTVAGATFTFATTQNFTGLADGTYQAIFSSVDDNSNVIIYVKLMP